MIDTRYPNRWFGSNPQAVPNQGRKLSTFERELPKDWRAALGLATDAEPTAARDAADEFTGRG